MFKREKDHFLVHKLKMVDNFAVMENDLLTTRIAASTGLSPKAVSNVLMLFNEGNTLPFIARYRKERTGNLDEVAIERIQEEHEKLKALLSRRETVLQTIEDQGLLTPALKQRITTCWDATELEDIYLPYKPKRKTKATVAREQGLTPLAEWVSLQTTGNPRQEAKKYLNNDVTSVDDALAGAKFIIAEEISEQEPVRKMARQSFERTAAFTAKPKRGKKEAGAKYKDYFDYSEPLKNCPSHRVLALFRGEKEGFLNVKLLPDVEELNYRLQRRLVSGQHPSSKVYREALEDCIDRLLLPSIETEFRNLAKEKADAEAIDVFAKNLQQLLLSPPLGSKPTLGIDPGYRTGCKVVALDKNGNLLHNTAIYPHPPQNDLAKAEQTIATLIKKYSIEAIAIGNGTAGKETHNWLKNNEIAKGLNVFMVSESGASIYSASKVAREEFPDQDITVRGAVSIARRLLDPLAELVKLDPKTIGVGQYQHDVNQVALKRKLDQEVENCVNKVGVQLNTASQHLLMYVSGLGPSLAKNIVEYREKNGPFKSRKQLLKVARLGEKAFEQSAGFLRLPSAKSPLDNTGVHPERYGLVEQIARDLGVGIDDLIAQTELYKKIDKQQYVTADCGLATLNDIFTELAKPGLDPRGSAKAIEFSASINSINDLSEGQRLIGVITNITNFGAFVDIGVKQDGLVHISELANKFVSDPNEVVKLGQQVNVVVTGVDVQRSRIQLSIKQA